VNEFNVIDRVCASVKKSTTAIVLTHNINFLFVESVVLPKLREVGSPHLTIFADAACAANSYQSEERLLSKLGSRYRVVPVDLGAARRFHPKAFFLCGEESASLAVGSGNTTHGGWSANREIWSDFTFPGDGGAQIASFRDYLEEILLRVPAPSELRGNSIAAFSDPANVWTQTLPPPSGLGWTPNATPLLDQITAFAGDEITSIDLLSPYFDPSGTALGRLASIAKKQVRVFLQPKRAGLSQDMANALPDKVSLCSIETSDENKRNKFIHAKAYVLETPSGTVVVAGSANCSQAALLADANWGNAELVSLARMNAEEVSALWDGFDLGDTAPTLPAEHPSAEWEEMTSPDLRILSARKDGTRLSVHFKTSKPLLQLYAAFGEKLQPIEAERITGNVATFFVEGRPSSLKLRAACKDNSELTSASSWIDDERSLRMAAPERMLRERLEDAAARGKMSGGDYLNILELYVPYLQKPVASSGKHHAKVKDDDAPPISFNEEDIYSDGFGRPAPLFDGHGRRHGSESDPFSLFASFFQTRERKGNGPTIPLPRKVEDDPPEDGESKPDAVREAEDAAEREKIAPRIARALARIEQGVANSAFVTSRPPDRLAADIGLLSLFLAKARIDGYIDGAAYRERTLSIWNVLFFGSDGASGSIPLLLEKMEQQDRELFIEEMRSPMLTAAMTLSCMIDWENADLNARGFRFASALLAARHPWLSQGGTREDIFTELDEIAEKLLPASDREQLFALWAGWLRDGDAIANISKAFSGRPQPALAALCPRRKIAKGELVWHIKCGFCTVQSEQDGVGTKSIELLPIDQSDPFKILPQFAAPLSDLLLADIGISDNVRQQTFSLMHGVSFGGANPSLLKAV
jgi:hypothetical protein